MIAIADSGSTKTDWVILNEDLTENFRTETIGFNPYHIDADSIGQEISKNLKLKEIAEQVKSVYFYGSGCSNESAIEIVKNGLKTIYTNADFSINHDLLAACYAVYRGKPAMVCILGTGSNACYFDGENIKEATPSLAYILGDEGSGCYMGKKLVHAYFTKKMPKDLKVKFKEQYDLDIVTLNENVYKKPLANAYLASFSKFVYENKEHTFMQHLIFNSMRDFFENQVLPNPEARFSEVNFIGSIAHFFEDEIKTAAANLHLEVGQIVRKPIDSLVNYHIKYILNR